MHGKVIKAQFLCIGWSVGFSAGQFWKKKTWLVLEARGK
jgi:hypothetical protein